MLCEGGGGRGGRREDWKRSRLAYGTNAYDVSVHVTLVIMTLDNELWKYAKRYVCVLICEFIPLAEDHFY